MCLHPAALCPVPAATAAAAHGAFPQNHPYLRMGDRFGALFQDEQFTALYPQRGQPAAAPWRLALVTLLQFAEGLSDRQAAAAVRRCIDWKYLLRLELHDPGFDASVLSEFRTRLVAGSAELLLFETLLTHFREQQLLKARGTQRTDATEVLAVVRTLNRLELAGETLRHALNALAVAAPSWLLAHTQPEWAERYARRFEESRLPQLPPEREALAQAIGVDGFRLLCALWAETAPRYLREIPAVETLRQVWVQQFAREEAQVRWRTPKELPPAALAICSPYDPEARYGKKRQTEWVGYKVHVTETCDPEGPLLITDVQTVPSPSGDTEALPPIQAALQARDLLPARQLADGAYIKGTALITSRTEYGIDLVGPAPQDTGWQAQAGAGFAASDFTVEWEARRVRCPQGQESAGWHERVERGEPIIQVQFAQAVCAACPCRSECTRAERSGRRVTLRPQAASAALQAARERMRTKEYAATYAARAGIEGSLSQGVRRCGLRQCRYVGTVKVHLQHVLTAAALNFVRVGEWLADTPRARTRESAFVRLVATA